MRVTPENVEKLARRKEDENWDFRSFLKRCDIPSKEIDAMVREITDRVWARFDCTTCGRCCRLSQVGLAGKDQDRLAGQLGISVEELRTKFLQPLTAEERGDFENEGQQIEFCFNSLPCPFLQGCKCSVYEGRPEQCRDYPYLYEPDLAFRMIDMLSRAPECPIVLMVLEELKAAVDFRPGRR